MKRGGTEKEERKDGKIQIREGWKKKEEREWKNLSDGTLIVIGKTYATGLKHALKNLLGVGGSSIILYVIVGGSSIILYVIISRWLFYNKATFS